MSTLEVGCGKWDADLTTNTQPPTPNTQKYIAAKLCILHCALCINQHQTTNAQHPMQYNRRNAATETPLPTLHTSHSTINPRGLNLRGFINTHYYLQEPYQISTRRPLSIPIRRDSMSCGRYLESRVLLFVAKTASNLRDLTVSVSPLSLTYFRDSITGL